MILRLGPISAPRHRRPIPAKGTVLPAKKHPTLRPYAGQERR